MKFTSTRKNISVSGAEAIVAGIAEDGGLFVPESFPTMTIEETAALAGLDYPERAAKVIGKFLPEFTELPVYAEKSYSRFDGDPAPLVKLDEGKFVLELWHGPTHAFKDIALTMLPHLLTGAKKAMGRTERTLVLVATSGDTGKAALEGFCDVDGTDVIVYYPTGGVSELQKLQMMTQRGSNVEVKAIRGNFDDAQTAVKKIFADEKIRAELAEKGFALSSANSINFGRLVPQVAYYFSAYADLLAAGEIEKGDKVDFCVPTGNFGNILAGWYAKKMGLPVGKLICASNENNVLTDFFRSGTYDRRRPFRKTTSPSMDILISSNLERLVFETSGRDCELTAARMRELSEKGSYTVTDREKEDLGAVFSAGWASMERTARAIREYFDEYGYIVDPHTAVALAVCDDIGRSDAPVVVLSTASPFKFVDDVLTALGEQPESDELASMKKLEELTALPLPDSLSELPVLPRLHKDIIDKEAAADAVLEYARAAAQRR